MSGSESASVSISLLNEASLSSSPTELSIVIKTPLYNFAFFVNNEEKKPSPKNEAELLDDGV